MGNIHFCKTYKDEKPSISEDGILLGMTDKMMSALHSDPVFKNETTEAIDDFLDKNNGLTDKVGKRRSKKYKTKLGDVVVRASGDCLVLEFEKEHRIRRFLFSIL